MLPLESHLRQETHLSYFQWAYTYLLWIFTYGLTCFYAYVTLFTFKWIIRLLVHIALAYEYILQIFQNVCQWYQSNAKQKWFKAANDDI
jgi:hypothetical protein